MRPSNALSIPLAAVTFCVGLSLITNPTPLPGPDVARAATSTADADELLRRQPVGFVPNLGQWEHAARFVQRRGPMTIFVEDRGWVLDLERSEHGASEPFADRKATRAGEKRTRKLGGVALSMTFEGDARKPELVGEQRLAYRHNYFLGTDESRWRTDVPVYSAIRWEDLYPGVDLRLRDAKGVPEYDLLLAPGADLSSVTVHVGGAQGLSMTGDGSLVIATALGPVTQSAPRTWQVGADGRKRAVVCSFKLLGADCYGFSAPGWEGDTNLTIDPGLVWSTFLGGSAADSATALSVDASGVVTVAGWTRSSNLPMTRGSYDGAHNGAIDAFVSRLDPNATGSLQLVYCTFLGGSGDDAGYALAVDARGVVTVAGMAGPTGFPTTTGAYDTSHNGPMNGADAFVCRLDPSKAGSAQLLYSTFLGGSGADFATVLAVGTGGVVTVGGNTWSSNFPATTGAYDTTHSGPVGGVDVFVSRLDPSKTGNAQLLDSTFFGGKDYDYVLGLAADAGGVVTVAGLTYSPDYPTTTGAYQPTAKGGGDAFVGRLDWSKSGSAQLVYSTLFGGSSFDRADALFVDARGTVTVAGDTTSANLPTTTGAYDTTYNGKRMGFVGRLDPRKTGNGQLVYSTFLGGTLACGAAAVSVDASGVVTVTGYAGSQSFPTTAGAHDTTYNGGTCDTFVSRLDPSKSGSAQMIYSTFLGGNGAEYPSALAVDASGAATVVGLTTSSDFTTTAGAYDRSYNGPSNPRLEGDAYVSRLDMGVALRGDRHELPIKLGGTQRLTANAGKAHARRLYWVFGSITGTDPGINLLGVHIPLVPDLYTDVAMGAANTAVFTSFKGTLDTDGIATASFNVPDNLPLPSGFTFYHAYVVYDTSVRFYMASNAVPLRMK